MDVNLNNTQPRVSSPASTSGSGTFFEQYVAAYWLSQLLVQGVPPILIDSIVVEVCLQTERLGWKTDDFLVICENPDSVRRKLVGQVKKGFTVSASNDECKKAIIDFWQDFFNEAKFSRSLDRFVLVVQRGTNTLMGSFGSLLNTARAARDGAEFESRLSTPGLISAKAIDNNKVLKQIIGEHENRQINNAEIWPFLSALYLISLDLDSSTNQAEAQIKTLLAYAAQTHNGRASADSIWAHLLEFASTAMSQSLSVTLADLPSKLRNLAQPLGGNQNRVLSALRNHTGPVFKRIRTTIGDSLHLQRRLIVQEILNALNSAQVVIVTGPAGFGKSAVGKCVAEHLVADHFVFAFRVEEFAQPHIDATLSAAQIPASATEITAILAAQEKKLVVIESVERLLEKTTRDAFSDLMTVVVGDPSMRVILTCRDYSVEQVRASFLRLTGLIHIVISVPALNDDELELVANEVPALARPIQNRRLRNLLRNPYYLDKALKMPWDAKSGFPETEREFRLYFWQETVMVVSGPITGFPRMRAVALQRIAIERARALTDFIPTGDLDPAVVDSLLADSLAITSLDNPLRIAVAHDVLEDWAILQWIEEQFDEADPTLSELSNAIGTHPALRRTYRKWLSELLERKPDIADKLFNTATHDSDITSQFRDDTLVSLLKAPLVPQLLARHEDNLLKGDLALLKRVIYLLRVACVTTPKWVRSTGTHGSLFNIPEGAAWGQLLKQAHSHFERLGISDRPLLIGFIEDAVRGVDWKNPSIDGAEAVVGIAYALLPHLDHYRSDNDSRRRVLSVLAKLPAADPGSFEYWLRKKESEEHRRDRIAEEFQNLLLTSTEGMPAVRDLPNVMVLIATECLLLVDSDVGRETFHNYSHDIEIYFGIKQHTNSNFFPSSALRGPWFSLLQEHPKIGLDFYFKVFNHSVHWYVNPRWHDPLEEAWEVKLVFADGSEQKQWTNSRLWTSFRGTSVTPYALQSMLMGLEKWLLHLGQSVPSVLDQVLVKILRNSDSASLSAVVASCAIAYPHSAGEALLVLLSAKDYIQLDLARAVSESSAQSSNDMFLDLIPGHKIHYQERQQSNHLEHRRYDLEAAIRNLQFGSLRDRVHAILDRHLAELPAPESRSESDLIWQLAINRMDMRQFTVTTVAKPTPEDDKEGQQGAQKKMLLFEPKLADPKLREMVKESGEEHQARNRLLGLLMWGMRAFEGKLSSEEGDQWKERLALSKEIDRSHDAELGVRNGPGVVAAVCVRDHWTDMSPEEREWCINVVCEEVMRHANNWSTMARTQHHSMSADRSCASVLGKLLATEISESARARSRDALAAAITHPVKDVTWYATWGINSELWLASPSVFQKCIDAIATHEQLVEQAFERNQRRYFNEGEAERINASIVSEVRKSFWTATADSNNVFDKIKISSRTGLDALARILTIYSVIPNERNAVIAFERASKMLVAEWDSDDRDPGQQRERHYESEQTVSDRILRFAMRTDRESATAILRPIIDAVDRHTREISAFLQGLLSREDQEPNTPQYWYLWGLFAEKIKLARWLRSLGEKHSEGDGIVSAIFLNTRWKEGVQHWRSLEGYAQNIDLLFSALPPTSIVLDRYLRFLYDIGERSLPAAFLLISQALRSGKANEMLADSETIFVLEVILQRHVYGRPTELKKEKSLRMAVLEVLDLLVENGSSAAFRMRDDFVTPAA
jgi:hypothetical protein